MLNRFIALLTLSFSLNSVAQHVSAPKEDLSGMIAAFRCSGALVSVGQELYDSALILSAGHCSADEPNYVHQSGYAKVDVSIRDQDEHGMHYYFDKSYNSLLLKNFKLASIYYGTMTKEDVTIFKALPSTRTLRARGLRIFTLAQELPQVGQELKLTSALWGKSKDCRVERIIKNNDEEMKLFGVEPEVPMENTILLSEDCEAKGGWSGSPLYDSKTRKIYGVASRVVEAREGSELYKPNAKARVLVSSVSKLSKCFDSRGELDLAHPACELPR